MIAVAEFEGGEVKQGGNWMLLDDTLEGWQQRFRGQGEVIPQPEMNQDNLLFFRFVSGEQADRIFVVNPSPKDPKR